MKGNPVGFRDPTGHDTDVGQMTGGQIATLSEMWNALKGLWGDDQSPGGGESVAKSNVENNVSGAKDSGSSRPRGDLKGGKLNDEMLAGLTTFVEENNAYFEPSTGSSRSATRNRPYAGPENPGDSKTSQHYTGNAFDFRMYRLNDKNEKVYVSVEETAHLAYQSRLFNRVEISTSEKGRNFVHVDLHPDHDRFNPRVYEQVRDDKDPKGVRYDWDNDSRFWRNYNPKDPKYPSYPVSGRRMFEEAINPDLRRPKGPFE